MRKARLLLGAAAAALVVVAAAAAARAPRQTSPIGAFQLRSVQVAEYPTVRLVVRSANPSAEPAVFENGAQITDVRYANLGTSKAIVLAIDRSQSMTGTPLARAAAAAKQLLQRKQPLDRVELVTFGSTALAAAEFSTSAADATAALSSIAPDPTPGTALYDAAILSANQLRAQKLAGRVLVLLTDGHDLGSGGTLRAALRAARRADVVIDTIALGHAAATPLKALAAGTGGSFYSSPTPAALSSVYARVSSELDHIWNVTYTTNALPGERIVVSLGSPHGPRMAVELPITPTHPNPLVPRFLLRGAGGVVLLVVAVAGLIVLAVRRLRAVPRSERIKQRVLEHTRPPSRRGQQRKRPPLAQLVELVNRRLRGIPQLKRLERLVEAAAIPASPATVLAASGGLGFVAALLIGVGTGSPVLAVMIFLVGVAGPLLGLHALARRRVAALENQLPDTLATIAGSLKVGHGLKQALQTVAGEDAPPVSVELRRVLAEARLGRPLEEALVAMCERLASEDLLYVATAVDVQSQVGGSLAGVFETVAETVRDRQQHRRRLRAVTSTSRATATVMAIMPFGFLALMLVISPHYVLPFLESHIGHVLMLASLVSIAIGAFLLNRIASVKS